MKGAVLYFADEPHRCWRTLVCLFVKSRFDPHPKAYCTEFNWAYRDGYEEIPFIQQSFLFTLYLLHRHGDDWKPFSFYEDRFLQAFPMIYNEVEPTAFNTVEEEIRNCYSLRVLERFLHFMGLARQFTDQIFY